MERPIAGDFGPRLQIALAKERRTGSPMKFRPCMIIALARLNPLTTTSRSMTGRVAGMSSITRESAAINRRCGERLYWLCPYYCRRRCEVVVMASHALSWGCRKCFKLRYHCQGLNPAYRLQNRADTIWSRLEGDSEMAIKPKGMRWRTFNRLCDRAESLSRNADAWFVAGLGRLGFAGIDEALSDGHDDR
jgi:hypothetical protein